MKDHKQVWTIIGIAAVVVLIGTYFLASPQDNSNQLGSDTTNTVSSDGTDSQPSVSTETGSSGERVLGSESFVLSNNIEYLLERFAVLDASGKIVKTDQRIVSDLWGKRTVIVSSVKAKLPELGTMGLKKFVVRKTPELIVFVSASFSSEAAYGSFYKFDLKTNTFTELLMASRFIPYTISQEKNPELFSPDGTKFLSLYDRTQQNQTEARNLYLVNVADDQASALASVKPSESLSQSIGSGGIPRGVVSWKNDIVTYSAFSATDPLSSEAGKERQAIEERTVSVNPNSK